VYEAQLLAELAAGRVNEETQRKFDDYCNLARYRQLSECITFWDRLLYRFWSRPPQVPLIAADIQAARQAAINVANGNVSTVVSRTTTTGVLFSLFAAIAYVGCVGGLDYADGRWSVLPALRSAKSSE